MYLDVGKNVAKPRKNEAFGQSGRGAMAKEKTENWIGIDVQMLENQTFLLTNPTRWYMIYKEADIERRKKL